MLDSVEHASRTWDKKKAQMKFTIVGKPNLGLETPRLVDKQQNDAKYKILR